MSTLNKHKKARDHHTDKLSSREAEDHGTMLRGIWEGYLKDSKEIEVKIRDERSQQYPQEINVIGPLEKKENQLIEKKARKLEELDAAYYPKEIRLKSINAKTKELDEAENVYSYKLAAYKQSWGSTVAENGIRIGLASAGAAAGFALAPKLTPWFVKKASQTSWFRQLPEARQQHLQQKTLPKIFTGVTMALFAAITLLPSQMIIHTWA